MENGWIPTLKKEINLNSSTKGVESLSQTKNVESLYLHMQPEHLTQKPMFTKYKHTQILHC